MVYENTSLLLKKGSPTLLAVVLHPRAYSTLLKVAKARVPQRTYGALVGKSSLSGPNPHIAISQIVPLEMVDNSGLKGWQALSERLAGDENGLQLVGWFCADPGIGVFPQSVDVATMHRHLIPDGVLLVVNPAADTGAFYMWRNE